MVALVTSVLGGTLVAPAAAGGQDTGTDECDDGQHADDGGANANDDTERKTLLSGTDIEFDQPGLLANG